MTGDQGRVLVAVTDRVDEQTRRIIEDINAASRDNDGVAALDDQVRVDLQVSEGHSRHVLATLPNHDVVGYAHLRRTELGPDSAHLVVSPEHRRQGVGTALVERLVAESGERGLRVWAHGDDAAARFLSGRLGFTRVRDLWQMRRSLSEPLPDPSYPDDVTVRTFEVGRDEAAWLDVNARAFAHHPEQGDTDLHDLEQRIRQPWFDAEGFFLAARADRLLGFHWTKVHPAEGSTARRFGEVYVVGVAPEAQSLGLGKSLTLTGLIHLRRLGLDECILYVEADNAPAVTVYEKLGFTMSSVDVMYERR